MGMGDLRSTKVRLAAVALCALACVPGAGCGRQEGERGATPTTVNAGAPTQKAQAAPQRKEPGQPVMQIGTVTVTAEEPDATAGGSRARAVAEVDWDVEPPFDMLGAPAVERFDDVGGLPSQLAFSPVTSALLNGAPRFWVDMASLPGRSWLIIDYRDAVDRETRHTYALVRVEMRSPTPDPWAVVDADCLDCSEAREVQLAGRVPAFAGRNRTATSVAWVTDDGTTIVVKAPPDVLTLADAIRIADDIEESRAATADARSRSSGRDSPERGLVCADGEWVADFPPTQTGLRGTLEDAVRVLLAGRVRASDVVQPSARPDEAHVVRGDELVLIAHLHRDNDGGWHLDSAQGCGES